MWMDLCAPGPGCKPLLGPRNYRPQCPISLPRTPRESNPGPASEQSPHISEFGFGAPLFILVNVTDSLEQRPKPRTRLIVVVTAVALAIGLLIFALTRGGSPSGSPSPQTQTPTPATASTPAATAATTTPAAPETTGVDTRLTECTQVSEGFVPNRFRIESLDAEGDVLALNLDADGNIAAPPFDQPHTASWWSGGPMPGDDRGKAVMSIHTYNPSLPPALGNDMFDGGESQLQPGDIIKLFGDDGQVLCYEYTGFKKIWVDEYDPYSDVMVDFEGDPELAIVICWDFDKGTRDWDSRILFYADPIIPTA